MKNLEDGLTQLNQLKNEREQLITQMTSGLESAEIRKDLFAVYQGNLDKKTAFKRHLETFGRYESAVEEQQTQSESLMSNIDSNMSSFNSLKGKSGKGDKMEFFASIDEGLKLYYENMNLLSNGAKFYKQMHTYLNSLHLYINDFVTSRKVEKDDMVNQLNGGGSGPAPGQPGAPYNPAFIPQNNPYGGSYYQ